MNKLKRSENELSEFVLQQIPYGILLEDINRKISSVNNEFLTIFNLHSISKELIGLDCNIMLEQSKAKFLDPNTFQKFINDSVIKKEKLTNIEFELINNQHIALSYIPCFLNGEFCGHCWCYNDITEKKNAFLSLKTQEIFFKNILDSLPADIAIFDSKHKYLFLNKTAIKDDIIRDWMIGKTDFEYCEYRNVDPKLAKERREKFEEMITFKKDVFWEDTFQKLAGKTKVTLRIFHPYFNLKEELEFVVGYGIDITEIKNKDLKLLEEKEKSRVLIKNLKEVVFNTNIDGNFTSLNPVWSKITGHSIANSINKNILQFIPEITDTNLIKTFLSNLESKDLELTVQIKTKTGIKWVEAYFAKVYNKQQHCISLWGTFIDITEKKKSQDKLLQFLNKEKELNELKSRFVNMVSHEVRTPLAGILSSLELLEIINSDISEHLKRKNEKHYVSIKNQILRIGDLINNVLSLGKIEAGKFDLNLEEIDVIKKISSLIKENFNLDPNNKIKFNHEGTPYITTLDWKLIIHTLINLLSNAYKYSKSSKPPEITVIFEDKFLKIRIKDYGIGIPAEDISKLFNPFSRASNVGNIAGTGLGLTIVKHLIELHDGDISVESKENSGSTFTINLPRIIN